MLDRRLPSVFVVLASGRTSQLPSPDPNSQTIRLRLLKIAARVIETTSRVCIAFAASHPETPLFRDLAFALTPTPV